MKKKSKILSLTNTNAIREITRESIGKTTDENIRDLSISANGTIWAVILDPNATEKDAGGGPVKYKEPSGKKWKPIDSGGAVKVDGGPKGSEACIINNRGEVWLLEIGKKPTQLAGENFAREISIGSDDTIWVITLEAIHGGGAIQYWENGQWHKIPIETGAIKITGTPEGKALIIDTNGIIASLSKNGDFEQLSGENFAKEISVAPDGSTWIISCEHHKDGGNKVSFQLEPGTAWQDIDAGAVVLDAGFS